MDNMTCEKCRHTEEDRNGCSSCTHHSNFEPVKAAPMCELYKDPSWVLATIDQICTIDTGVALCLDLNWHPAIKIQANTADEQIARNTLIRYSAKIETGDFEDGLESHARPAQVKLTYSEYKNVPATSGHWTQLYAGDWPPNTKTYAKLVAEIDDIARRGMPHA